MSRRGRRVPLLGMAAVGSRPNALHFGNPFRDDPSPSALAACERTGRKFNQVTDSLQEFVTDAWEVASVIFERYKKKYPGSIMHVGSFGRYLQLGSRFRKLESTAFSPTGALKDLKYHYRRNQNAGD